VELLPSVSALTGVPPVTDGTAGEDNEWAEAEA